MGEGRRKRNVLRFTGLLDACGSGHLPAQKVSFLAKAQGFSSDLLDETHV